MVHGICEKTTSPCKSDDSSRERCTCNPCKSARHGYDWDNSLLPFNERRLGRALTEQEKIELEQIAFGVGFGRTDAAGVVTHAPSWTWDHDGPWPDVIHDRGA